MEISVIMITHNREALVSNMINDILNQTFREFEFIIVDNGSVDTSSEIVKAYAKKDERIVTVQLPQEVSIGKARNIGLAHAAGEFVAYVDDDDRCNRDYLAFLHGMLENERVDFAMCGAVEDREGVIGPQCLFEGRHRLNAKQAVTELLKRERMRAALPTKLIRRTILQKYPFKEDCRHEDIHTIYKYLSEIRQGVIADLNTALSGTEIMFLILHRTFRLCSRSSWRNICRHFGNGQNLSAESFLIWQNWFSTANGLI